MERTGESYAAARRVVLQQSEPEPKGPWHFAGNVPATTALRILLTNAGVRDPRTSQPFSEAMLYGIAGGIGIGVFQFFYQKENFASFFVAGRHLLHDDLAYLSAALDRFGIKPTVRESSSPKAAAKALVEALTAGPCVAWVDMTHLPHRGMPSEFSGGGYHVVTVYRIGEDGTALVGDLTDEPVRVPGPALTEARGRIKKFKNRLLSIPTSGGPKDLAPLVRGGLRTCHGGLTGAGAPKSARTNFSLEAVRLWADRLHGTAGKESWSHVFPPGPRLWQGLTAVYRFIEHWGNGGGLGRPLFAEFLTEAADGTGDAGLRGLARMYSDLGRDWTELAEAALPTTVPEFRQARELYARIGELTNSGGDLNEVRATWDRVRALGRQAKDRFPLSDADCDALRAGLQQRVRDLHAAEVAAHAALGRLLS